MKYPLFALLMCAFLIAKAQKSYPVFATKDDSVGYARTNEAMMNIFKSGQEATSAKKLDSLFKLISAYNTKIIGTKMLYSTSSTFTPLEDILSGKTDVNNVTKLSIADYRSSRLPKVIYSCSQLSELELVNTSVKKLPHKLNRLGNLKNIYIYNNKSNGRLKLAKNTVTKELLITGTVANQLPKSYKGFKSLQHLNLRSNIGLSAFPQVYDNKNLKKLTLYGNTITLNDLRNGSALNLEELNLQQNKITTVPAAIGSFTSLKKLTFNYNQVSEVNATIGNLKKLEEVSFYNNKLTSIPEGIYKLSQLKSIDLYHNEISKIEPDLVNLSSLEVLYLSNNQLAVLPDNMGQLTSLRELYVSNNKLFALPTSLKDLNKLTVFRANKNKLSDFPDFVFSLPLVENIDISSNDIREIPYSVAALPKLGIFVMSNNPITKEDETIEKLITDLRKKGVVVHQNYISEQQEEVVNTQSQN
jgi:Leucine-rich repeat (LRR) protein